mgnify:CR=1 FL=1
MERVFIFIDGSNFYHALKEEIGRTNIDFLKLAYKLCKNRNLVGVNYYNAPLKKEYNPEQYKAQQKFFHYIRNLPGFNLQLGHLELRKLELKTEFLLKLKNFLDEENIKLITNIKYPVEKGVDILLATDMLSLAYYDIFDTGILISGDGDFAYVIKKIKLLRKKIEVAFFPKRRCYHLRQICDMFIPFNKNFFEFYNEEKNC